MRNKPQLSIIAHATEGDGFIKEGVHLRWAFHHKLGFPPDGFRLYRRESDPANRICISIPKIISPEVKLPYRHTDSGHPRKPKAIFRSKAGYFKVKEKLVGSSARVRYLDMTNAGTVEVEFSTRTPRIELEFLVDRDTSFRISALSGRRPVIDREVVTKKAGLRAFTLETSMADKLVLEGSGIRLTKICYWICEDEGANPWEGPINGPCGFGLPTRQAERITRDKGYSERIRKTYLKDCDIDWGVAACRLGPENICDFKGENFKDLKDVMESMWGEGTTVPTGWNSLSYAAESSCPDDGDTPTLDISPYELLLLQSENPGVARMLGIYWIDSTAEDGKYYDYKVEASWPADPRSLWKLDDQTTFEEFATGQRLPNVFYKDNCVFAGPRHMIVENSSGFARVDRGLACNYPSVAPTVIFFWRPVREVQVFIRQDGPRARLTALSATGTVLDVCELLAREGVMGVHGEGLRGIRLEGKGIVILRVHHDAEFLEFGDRKAIICGVRKAPEVKLSVPAGLKATCLLGSVTEVGADCKEMQSRFRVGLRWDLDGDENVGLGAGAPVGYLVERTGPRGDIVLVTGDNPVHVVPVDEKVAEEIDRVSTEEGQPSEQRDCSGASIKDRQYFKDSVDEKGVYFYRICAVDIFGRRSDFSAPAKVTLIPPLPAPPVDVTAKFIDINTYDASEDVFTDPNLSAADKAWLRANSTSALVVGWSWTDRLREQSPDARRFNIHFKNGWLNLLRGMATAVRPAGGNFEIDTDIARNLPANSLAGEWLRQGRNRTFKIISNSAGTNTTITVLRPPDYLGLPPAEVPPKAGVEFTLPVTRLVSDGGAAKEYTDPAEWGPALTGEDVVNPSRVSYKVYYPLSSFEADAGNKTRYAQVSVGTVTDEGAGSVSTPASVMSVYRTPPAKEDFPDSGGLSATPADFYGKSSFAYRWPRPGAGSGKKYSVYRAMDETVIMTDRELRGNPGAGRNDAFYQTVLDHLGIALSNADKDNFKAAEPDYASFNNNMMKALASLPGNEAAFSKLNEDLIDPADPAYADRRIPGEPSYTPVAAKLLFVDSTLDGRAPNRYFYRLRAVDEIGNMSPFYDSTLPVSIPQTMPPVAPAIAKISGGDKSITLEWAPRPGAGIVGYLVYRAEDELKSNDCRKMRLMKHAPADAYSLALPATPIPPDFEYKYTDDTAEPGTNYYYRLVAVSKDADNNDLRSKPSSVKESQSYDLTPPDPPAITSGEWVDSGGKAAIRIAWAAVDAGASVIVQSRPSPADPWRDKSGWLDSSTTFFVDLDVKAHISYTYRIGVRSASGILNTTFIELDVPSFF